MVKVHYFFDPMCGWCYGATSLIEVLADMAEVEIIYHPGGMIAKHAIAPSFKQHIVESDKRIVEMTKAHLGDAYKTRVTGTDEFILDSYLPTQAFLVGINMGMAPHLMLKAIQEAHYQEGKHLDKPETLQTLAVSLGLDEILWQEKMANSESVMMKEIEISHRLMDQWQIRGYPTLMIEQHDKMIRLAHSVYYDQIADWKDYLNSFV